LTISVQDIGKYLGKPLEDSMGRQIGRLVGLTTDIKDEVKSIQVSQATGEVNQYPVEFVRIQSGRLVLLERWRLEAEELRKEQDIIKRRSQALSLLFKDGDIDELEYNQQKGNYEDLGKQAKERQETLVDTLRKVEARLEQQIRDLQSALTNNKMLFSASEIDEPTYRSVTESIRAGLELARKEKQDIDSVREFLQNIDSIEPEPPQPSAPTPPKIPDVVVIKMKDTLQT